MRQEFQRCSISFDSDNASLMNMLTFANKEDLARCGVREEICRQLGNQDGDGKAQPAASRMRRSSTATALCWEERDEPAHL